MSFIIDATGGYPSGVWYSSPLYVTARPTTKAPVTALYLRGRCAAAPNAQNSPTPHVPQPLLHWVRRLRPAWHFTDCDVVLLTEQARGGARQV